MAEQVMEEIAAELQRQYELCAIAIHHRTGRVKIGGTSVVIGRLRPAPCRCTRRVSRRH